MKSVLGLPDAAISVTEPEGETVICEVSVQLGSDDAEPEAEEDCLAMSDGIK